MTSILDLNYKLIFSIWGYWNNNSFIVEDSNGTIIGYIVKRKESKNKANHYVFFDPTYERNDEINMVILTGALIVANKKSKSGRFSLE